MNKNYTGYNAFEPSCQGKNVLRSLSYIALLFFSIMICGEVHATGCYNNAANGWSTNSPTQMGTPPCGSNGSLAVSSTAYTYFNSTAGCTYTFSASGGGWASYYLTWYQYNGSAWVVAYSGQNSISGVAGYTTTNNIVIVYDGSGCASYPSTMAPAWPGTSATLLYQQSNTLSNTTSTAAICGNGSTKALTATPANGTFSLGSGIGSVSGTTYTAPAAGTAAGTATVVYTDGSCTANAAFTVSAVPVLASQAGSTICTGSSFSYAPTGTIPTGGVTYAWSAPSGGASGGAAASGQSTVNGTLTNTGTTAITEVYSVTPTASTGGCSGNAFNVSVTVNPTPVLSAQSAPAICTGGSFSYTPTGGTIPSGTTYSWSAPSGGASGGAAASGQSTINGTLTNSTASAITEVYSVTPLSGSCTGSPFNVSVTVNPTPVLSAQSAPAICTGGSFSYTPTGGTIPSGTTYSWSAPTGGATGGAAASGQSTINGTLTNSTASAITEVYSVTPLSGSCTGSAFNVSVTVNPTPVISAQTAPAICSGGTVGYTPTGGTIPSGTTYSWSAPTGGATGGAAASGQSNINGTLSNTTSSPITEVYSVTPLSGSCTGAAFNVSVTVNPKPILSAQSAPAICTGGSFSYTPAGTIPSGTTYAWATPSGGASGGSSASGQTTVNGSLTNSTAAAITEVYSVTPTAGTGCVGSAFNVSVTVNPTPLIPSQTAPAICTGGTIAYSITGGTIPSGTTYAWAAPTGGAGGGAAASGQSNLNGTLTNSTSSAITEVYSVTPTAGSCTGSAFNVSVTVNPTPVLSAQSAPAICTGGSFSYTPTGGTIPSGTTYAWSSPTGGATGGAAASGQSTINGTLTNSTASAITEVYSVTPSSGSCTGAAFNVSVTVNPTPVISSQSAPAICTGSSLSYTPTGGTIPSGTTYSWSAPTGGATGGAAASGQTNINNGTLTNSTSSAVTEVYSVTPLSGSCTGAPFNVSVTVNPTPALSAQSGPTICTGSSFSYTPTGGTIPSGTTYSWSAPTGGATGGAAASGQTNISGGPLTNSTSSAITEIYSVTPTAGSCTGAAFNVSVTVNPTPAISSQSAPAICTGAGFSYTPTGTIPSGTTYSWSAPSGGAGGGAAASGQTTINGTLFNTTSVAVTDVYVVTPVSGSCTGSAFNVSVTVNPTPVLSNQSTSECAGSSFSYTPTGSVVPSGTVYTWSAPTGSGFTGSGSGGVGTTLTDDLTITSGTSTTTATYSVTPTSGTCTGSPFNVSVTLYYQPSLSAQSTTSCSGQLFIYAPTGTIPSGTTYAWSAPTGTGFTGGASNSGQSYVDGSLTLVSSLSPATATYSVTPTNGTCSGTPFNVSVTINSSPIITAQSTSTCTGTTFGFSPTGAIPPGTTYAWNNPSGSGYTGGTSASGQANVNGTLINSGSTPVTAVYSVTATAGACSGTPFNVSVTVNPVPVMNASQSTTACGSQTFSYAPTGSVVPSGMIYAWSAPTLGSGLSGSIGAQSGQSTLTDNLVNSTSGAVTATYTVTPSTAAGCTGSAFTVTVTVNPAPIATLTDNPDPCNGGHTAYVNITNGTSPFSFTLTYTGSASATTQSYTGTVPVEFDAQGASSITVSSITDANGCAAASVSGSPMTYPSRDLTSGNTQTCTVLAGSTQVFFDASNNLMASVTAGSTALGNTTVITTIDGSVQQFGPTSPQSYLQRHFQITPANNTAANVCLYISDAEVSALSTASASDNHSAPAYYQTFSTSLTNANITKYDGGSETPASHTTSQTLVITSITATHNPVVDGATYNGAWGLCFNVSGFSGFYIHADNVHSDPLPVTLINFTATAIANKYIELDWSTATEINNSGFQIERSSDGSTYESLGWVQGHGNSTMQNDYKYSDMTALPGIVYYYRLKQEDVDGNYAYSPVVSANLTGSLGFSLESLVPNPASDQVSIGVISNVSAVTTITMTDMLGREILKRPWEVNVGYNVQEFDLSSMAEGAYIVTITSGSITTSKRLVVNR